MGTPFTSSYCEENMPSIPLRYYNEKRVNQEVISFNLRIGESSMRSRIRRISGRRFSPFPPPPDDRKYVCRSQATASDVKRKYQLYSSYSSYSYVERWLVRQFFSGRSNCLSQLLDLFTLIGGNFRCLSTFHSPTFPSLSDLPSPGAALD